MMENNKRTDTYIFALIFNIKNNATKVISIEYSDSDAKVYQNGAICNKTDLEINYVRD